MVYKTIDGQLVRGAGTDAVARQKDPLRTAQAGPAGPSNDDAMARQRRQKPSDAPLPLAFKWVAQLPRSVQPLALLRQYPRIANMMAGMWQHPPSCRSYLHDLLTDRRGKRKGFPPEIVQELLALHVHYEHLHPPILDVYQDVDKQG